MLGGLSIVMKKPPRRQHVKSVCALRGGFFQKLCQGLPGAGSIPAGSQGVVCLLENGLIRLLQIFQRKCFRSLLMDAVAGGQFFRVILQRINRIFVGVIIVVSDQRNQV